MLITINILNHKIKDLFVKIKNLIIMNLKKNRVLKDNHTVKEIKITMFIKAT